MGESPPHPIAAPARQVPEVNIFDRGVNERRILTLLQKSGAMPAAEIAKGLDLSAQSASVITRALEAEGLIVRGDPVRGKVGKPLTPFRLNGPGAYSVGMRIGRRSADSVLMDLTGRVVAHQHSTHAYPTPRGIAEFARESLDSLLDGLDRARRSRVAGIGVGAPFELWKWLDDTAAPKDEMLAWREFSFETSFAEFTDLPVIVGNDASLACQGEAMFGIATTLSDFGYFYLGAFIGGGAFIDGRLYTGPTGNAGAFGSIPVRQADGTWDQLISHASIHQLEKRLEAASPGLGQVLAQKSGWTGFDDVLQAWLDETADHMAGACLTVVAAFDVPAIVIDAGVPAGVRTRLIEGVRARLGTLDHRGIRLPEIVEGRLGTTAGALGAGYQPIIERLLI